MKRVPPPLRLSFYKIRRVILANPRCKKRDMEEKRFTLFRAAREMTLTPSLSALSIASSIWLFMPCVAKGKKYCKKMKEHI